MSLFGMFSSRCAQRRRLLAASIPVVVAVGLGARYGLSGAGADAAGGVAYTALVYVLIAWIWPALPPVRTGGAALAFSALIELFELTPIPADLADGFSPIHLVLGETFAATDLVAYAFGALLAVAVDSALQRHRYAWGSVLGRLGFRGRGTSPAGSSRKRHLRR